MQIDCKLETIKLLLNKYKKKGNTKIQGCYYYLYSYIVYTGCIPVLEKKSVNPHLNFFRLMEKQFEVILFSLWNEKRNYITTFFVYVLSVLIAFFINLSLSIKEKIFHLTFISTIISIIIYAYVLLSTPILQLHVFYTYDICVSIELKHLLNIRNFEIHSPNSRCPASIAYSVK